MAYFAKWVRAFVKVKLESIEEAFASDESEISRITILALTGTKSNGYKNSLLFLEFL